MRFGLSSPAILSHLRNMLGSEVVMDVVNLSPEYESSYLVCLEEWSAEMEESGDRKKLWYNKMRDRGPRVKLAVEDDGPVGMVQYLPIEHSPALGSDLYLILCVWVHGHKGGVGDRQGRGIGTALLEAAEADVRELGAKGIAAWGVVLPFWMKARWFRKHGYRPVDRQGMRRLLWKPFAVDAEPPRWIGEGEKPRPVPGQVTVTAHVNGWCPASNIVYERAKRAAADLGDKVVFEETDTSEQEAMIRCGQSDCVFVDGRNLQKGPPPSYEKIHKAIEKRLAKL
jgi:GNAT superfamily N-acetyltransferase